MPTRAASLAVSTAKAVVNSAMPHSTGTRPAATDFAVSMMAIFSLRSSEVFSPTDPQTISPDTPSRIRPSMTFAVASILSDRSSLNCVVTAGKTPSQEMRGLIVGLRLEFSGGLSDPPGFAWKRWIKSERRTDFAQFGENRRLGQPELVELGDDGLGIASRHLTDRDRRVLEV